MGEGWVSCEGGYGVDEREFKWVVFWGEIGGVCGFCVGGIFDFFEEDGLGGVWWDVEEEWW